MRSEGYTWYRYGDSHWLPVEDKNNVRIIDDSRTKETVSAFEKPVINLRAGESVDARVMVKNGVGTDNYDYLTDSVIASVTDLYENNTSGKFEEGGTGYITVRITGLKKGTTTVYLLYLDDVNASVIVNVK